MPFDGIVTSNIVWDLNTQLQGGKIDKVYQPEHDEIVLTVHRGKEKHKVLLTSNSSNARIQFISDNPPNPANPPAFCMLMRKHIQGGRIDKIIQRQTERIVEFCIDSFNEMGYPTTKKIIVELMGKHSNITLMDDNQGRIIDSIKRISFDVNRYRQLLPGMTYVYPPSQNKLPFTQITASDLKRIIADSNQSISKALVNSVMGFSPFFSRSLCAMANITDDQPCSLLDDSQMDKLYETFNAIRSNINRGVFYPEVWLDSSGAPLDFHSFDYPDYTAVCSLKKFDTISQAQDFYYSQKKSTNRLRQKSSDIERVLKNALDKFYLKKSKLLDDITQAKGADIYRLKGELLFANIHKIYTGLTTVTVDNYYDGNQMTIALDPRLSPSENAQKYYKKYNKQKTALTEKTIQLEETAKEIDYLESTHQLLENADDYNDIDAIRMELISVGYIKRRSISLKSKSAGSPPHEYKTSEGFKILAGRNNKQNDQLTLKTANSKDLWFHTKDIPGTHVILFTEGKEPSPQSLIEAASVAAFHSKGKLSENVPVDYTLVKYVKKPSGAKPGMVIFDHNRTLYVMPKLP